MNHVVFITLGTREVDAAEIGLSHLPPRALGEYCIANLPEVRKKLRFPLLTPFIKYLETAAPNGRLDIFLVCTDQPPEIDERFRQFDTIFIAQLFEQMFKDLIRREKGALKTHILQLKEQVSYMDTMYNKTGLLLRKPTTKALLEAAERVVIYPQGGIDAINNSLVLNVLNIAREKVVYVYLDHSTNLCTELEFPGLFLEEQDYGKALELLRSFDYRGLQRLQITDVVRILAAYAEARLNFDLEGAKMWLGRLPAIHRNIAAEELADLPVRDQHLSLIREIVQNAYIKYRTGAYVDFLLRIWRIREALLFQEAFRILGSTEPDPDRWESLLKAFLKQPEQVIVRAKLEALYPDTSKLYENRPNTVTLKRFVDLANPSWPLGTMIDKTQPLSAMRNNSIGAHSFDPVSKSEIEQSLAVVSYSAEEMFSDLLHHLDISTYPYERLNTRIRTLLENKS